MHSGQKGNNARVFCELGYTMISCLIPSVSSEVSGRGWTSLTKQKHVKQLNDCDPCIFFHFSMKARKSCQGNERGQSVVWGDG